MSSSQQRASRRRSASKSTPQNNNNNNIQDDNDRDDDLLQRQSSTNLLSPSSSAKLLGDMEDEEEGGTNDNAEVVRSLRQQLKDSEGRSARQRADAVAAMERLHAALEQRQAKHHGVVEQLVRNLTAARLALSKAEADLVDVRRGVEARVASETRPLRQRIEALECTATETAKVLDSVRRDASAAQHRLEETLASRDVQRSTATSMVERERQRASEWHVRYDLAQMNVRALEARIRDVVAANESAARSGVDAAQERLAVAVEARRCLEREVAALQDEMEAQRLVHEAAMARAMSDAWSAKRGLALMLHEHNAAVSALHEELSRSELSRREDVRRLEAEVASCRKELVETRARLTKQAAARDDAQEREMALLRAENKELLTAHQQDRRSGPGGGDLLSCDVCLAEARSLRRANMMLTTQLHRSLLKVGQYEVEDAVSSKKWEDGRRRLSNSNSSSSSFLQKRNASHSPQRDHIKHVKT
eukprot:PhM_4_TR14246/c0_g1_i1/m.63057